MVQIKQIRTGRAPAATCADSISSECALRLATDRNRGEIGCLRPHTRASFHHQPEAETPNLQLSTTPADYPIFAPQSGYAPVAPTRPFGGICEPSGVQWLSRLNTLCGSLTQPAECRRRCQANIDLV